MRPIKGTQVTLIGHEHIRGLLTGEYGYQDKVLMWKVFWTTGRWGTDNVYDWHAPDSIVSVVNVDICA